MIIMVSYDGGPHWCLPRSFSEELGTAFAAREEEIEDELLEPSPSPGWNRWSIVFFLGFTVVFLMQ